MICLERERGGGLVAAKELFKNTDLIISRFDIPVVYKL